MELYERLKEHDRMPRAAYVDASRHLTAIKKTHDGESRLHFHDFFECELILNGTGTQVLDGTTYPLRRGCVYLLTPSDFHTVSGDGLLLVNVMFDEELLSPPLRDGLLGRGGLILYLTEEDTVRLERLAEALLREQEQEGEYARLADRALLEYLLVTLLRKAPPAERREDGALSDVLYYLNLHFAESPSLAHTAKRYGYTQNYFSTRFRELTGMGYTEFLTQLKLSRARRLLCDTVLSATEVAFSSGFGSLSAFYRAFRAEEGLSPLAYRALHKPS